MTDDHDLPYVFSDGDVMRIGHKAALPNAAGLI